MGFVLAGLLIASASGGVVAGLVASRKKTAAIEAVAATLPETPPAVESTAKPYREAANVKDDANPPRWRRVGKLHRHDYDLMIGRTLFR